jgi:hypothetical protein
VDTAEPFTVRFYKGYERVDADHDVNDLVEWKVVNATEDGKFVVFLDFS